LGQPLVVRVTDDGGNPVPGGVVLFQPGTGAGEVLPDRAQTDSLGRAFARWRLGPGAGAQTVRATVANVEGVTPVDFRAEAVATIAAGNQDLAEAAVEALAPPPDTAEAGASEQGLPVTDAPASTDPVPGSDTPVRVAARGTAVGGTHVCQVGEAGVRCRGANDRGQARSAPRPTNFVWVAGGVSHTCALDPQGTAYCWGANASGQIGDGSRADRSSPTEVETQIAFQMVSAGLAHSCALDGSGAAFCWGRNVGGQLGDASRDDRTTPVGVSGGRRFRSLVTGWNHTCGVGAGGEVWCWGLNSEGQLGDGTHLDRLVPTAVAGSPPFQVLAAGNGHTCGVTGGQVRCWGDNRFGQLGTGDQQGSPRPAPPVDLPDAATRVAAGAMHTCALLGDGRVYCWGQNVHGQLGDGSTTSRSVPTPVAGDVRFRSIEAGGGSTCGVSTEGAQHCWGLNQTGQLGDGSRTNRTLPTRVGG
jgi:alpha-tubulin suppressor-like RCC1 family protein